MDERLESWRPSGEELEQILAEMRPIIREVRDRSDKVVRAGR